MYLLYESYNDNACNDKESNSHTKIIGLYRGKKNLNNHLKEELQKIEESENWFYQETDTDFLDNKNANRVFEVFKDEIENYEDCYLLIVEKIKVRKESDNK